VTQQEMQGALALRAASGPGVIGRTRGARRGATSVRTAAPAALSHISAPPHITACGVPAALCSLLQVRMKTMGLIII
jgi:hypothetical protein